VACDTGAGLALFPLAAPLAAGGQATLPGFEPFGCQAPVLVITNEARTNGDPTSSAQRSFAVSTAPAPTALRALGVTLAGGGSGTVASSPSGISCGADCSESYAHGTQVTLTATPAAGSSFAGFGGDCAGTGPCTLSMTSARAVTATFEPLPGTVTPVVTAAGPTPARLDTVAPALTRLRLLPSRFRAARSGPALAALAGARLGLTLGEPATVTFRVARVTASGRLVRLRGLARRALPAGRSTLRYRGRLAGRTLRPGAYRLLVRARDAAGNVSPQRRAAFRIVPGSSRTPRAAER
jgi:hypothetical protein